VPLSTLPHEISTLNGGYHRPPRYRELYNLALDAKIPAQRGENGRWTVARRDVPMIAELYKATAT